MLLSPHTPAGDHPRERPELCPHIQYRGSRRPQQPCRRCGCASHGSGRRLHLSVQQGYRALLGQQEHPGAGAHLQAALHPAAAAASVRGGRGRMQGVGLTHVAVAAWKTAGQTGPLGVYLCQTAKGGRKATAKCPQVVGGACRVAGRRWRAQEALLFLQRKGGWSNMRLPALVLMLYCCCCLLQQAEFNASAEQGFQASPTWHQGSILAAEAGAAGPKMSTGTHCQHRGASAPPIICCKPNMSQLAADSRHAHLDLSLLVAAHACIALCL